MKIDMHTHCQPASRCAHHQPEELPAIHKEKGVDAIVLTNHYYGFHCGDLHPEPQRQAEIYVEIYERCRAAGEKIGVKVFFGAEIKLETQPYAPEFLLYGLSQEEFLRSYPLYHMTRRQLYEYCCERDILMVQAHPYSTQQEFTQEDLAYIHGIEAYNAHSLRDPRFADTLKLAKDNGKYITAASDFHHFAQAGSGGMIVPDSICDQFALRDHIRSGKPCIYGTDGILYQE